MRGTGQASFDQVAGAFEPVLAAAGAQAATIGAELFGFVDALESSASLRRALSDPARSGEDKARLVQGLLGGKVDERVADVVSGLARARWSTEADLVEAVERLGANAVLASAEQADAIETIEEELFRIDRLLAANRELRQALTDRSSEPSRRAALARAVLEGRVHAATQQLVERLALAPRGRSVSSALAALGRYAASRRARVVATVTAATVLTQEQERRLTSLLERAYGRAVQLNLSVDPEVLGGLRIQVGSEVVDSTVLARLDDARRRLAG